MKKTCSLLRSLGFILAFSTTAIAQVTTRSLTWNLTGAHSWPTVAAGNSWDNKNNWVITGTSTVPTTNVTNGDKLIIPNVAGVRINVTTNLSISLNNFVIETQGAARFNLNNGVDLTLSGAATAFSMWNAHANAGLTLGRRASSTNPTRLIINGIVKALNNTGAARVPSATSAVSLQALSSSSATATSAGYGGFLAGALPVSLGSIEVSAAGGQKVRISWTTLQEINTDRFNLQRSGDGINWNTISSTRAAGNSSQVQSYSVLDLAPAGVTNFYRLQMVDADGKTSVSVVKSIRLNGQTSITLYPNPANNSVTVLPGQSLQGEWQLRVFNSNGQVLLQTKYGNTSSPAVIDVHSFQNGTYYLQVSEGVEIQTSKLLVIHP